MIDTSSSFFRGSTALIVSPATPAFCRMCVWMDVWMDVWAGAPERAKMLKIELLPQFFRWNNKTFRMYSFNHDSKNVGDRKMILYPVFGQWGPPKGSKF